MNGVLAEFDEEEGNENQRLEVIDEVRNPRDESSNPNSKMPSVLMSPKIKINEATKATNGQENGILSS